MSNSSMNGSNNSVTDSIPLELSAVSLRYRQEGRFRAIDLQAGKQLGQWELAAGGTERGSQWMTLLGQLVNLALSKGQVCLPLDQPPSFEWRTDWPSIESWLEVVKKLKAVWWVDHAETEESGHSDKDGWNGQPLILEQIGDAVPRLYMARYYFYQLEVAEQIRVGSASVQLSETVLDEIREYLPKLFPKNQTAQDWMSSPDWQALAAVTAAIQPISLIIGGPGTGKTTTLTRLMALLLAIDPEIKIALAAPTGKAAARMTESIRSAKSAISNEMASRLFEAVPEQASTLHRLLGWGQTGYRYHKHQPLPYDCVVVDEASMIDLPMMRHLLQALSPTTKLVLLGDKHQLASVEAGSVLADLCGGDGSVAPGSAHLDILGRLFDADIRQHFATDSQLAGPLRNAVVELKTSHRFSSESGIGQLASQIKRGDFAASIDCLKNNAHPDAILIESPSEIELSNEQVRPAWLKKSIEGYRDYLSVVSDMSSISDASEVLGRFNRFRILVATRKGAYGVEGINAQVEEQLIKEGLLQRGGQWYVGRPIMITENDYDIGLFNGDIGIAVKDEKGQIRVLFQADNGETRLLLSSRLPRHETCFAMTVHKSQGSEFDEVLMILPMQWSQVISRELLYTGVTRAKQRFSIVASPAVWIQGIQSQIERASALREHLWRDS